MKKFLKKVKKIVASLFVFLFYNKISFAESITFYGGPIVTNTVSTTSKEMATKDFKMLSSISIVLYGILILTIGLIALIPKIPKKVKKIATAIILTAILIITAWMNIL